MDPYERLALVLDDGREIRFRDIRKFGRVGLYAADDHPFDDIGPEPLDPRFTLRAFRARIRGRRARLKPLLVDQSFIAGVGNIYADEALWRSRLHPLRSAASLRPHDERALYRNVLEILSVAVERRGILDRRLHGPRWRRRDAGAPRRLPAHRPAVSALRPPGPADRDRDPRDPLLLVLPAAPGGGSARGGEAPGVDDPAAGACGGRTEGAALGGSRRRGSPGPDAGRGREGTRARGADEGGGGRAAGGGAPGRDRGADGGDRDVTGEPRRERAPPAGEGTA